MDKYSVLFSLYEKESPENFRTAVDSMLAQTVFPDDIVVVLDGPLTKGLYAVLDEYRSAYPDLFNYVENEKNEGLGVSLAKGLLACKNELVARMDTDDIAKPDRCEKQLAVFAAHPEYSIVGGQIEEFVGEPTNIVGKRIVPCSDEDIKRFLKTRSPFNHMTVMFKKSAIIAVGNYKAWFRNEDYYLWLRLLSSGVLCYNLPDVLVTVRTGTQMYARRGGYRYYQSSKRLQKFMLDNKMITYPTYLANVFKRFVFQVLFPTDLRGFVFRKCIRKH